MSITGGPMGAIKLLSQGKCNKTTRHSLTFHQNSDISERSTVWILYSHAPLLAPAPRPSMSVVLHKINLVAER